ncbi:hypothetical protein BBO99_00003453 [Phytophthora kernoviae]|uniref:Cas12f1-like TNB domain-containing protein n=1 Tax=Phytophthora kernoviae TaxID=325452 RepID=A0A3R7K0U7_9STRA|nr:hypothetical protein BBI17_003492 [Phytophthora kernoviae]RLN81756.1 hypothetical protein BBO99_00003453 [Phytophthora kernoviae]
MEEKESLHEKRTGHASLNSLQFKMLISYKMEPVNGSLIKYGEENTSETCSNCGGLKQDLGGNTVYTYEPYGEDLDKDVNKSFSK